MAGHDVDGGAVRDIRVVVEHPAAGATGPIHGDSCDDRKGQQQPGKPVTQACFQVHGLDGLEMAKGAALMARMLASCTRALG